MASFGNSTRVWIFVFSLLLGTLFLAFLTNRCGSPGSLISSGSATNCTYFAAGTSMPIFPVPEKPVATSRLQLFIDPTAGSIDDWATTAPAPNQEALKPVTATPLGDPLDPLTSTVCVPETNNTVFSSTLPVGTDQAFQFRLFSTDALDDNEYNMTACGGYIDLPGVLGNDPPCDTPPDYLFCCDYKYVPQDNLVTGISSTVKPFICDSTQATFNDYSEVGTVPAGGSDLFVTLAIWFTSSLVPNNTALFFETGAPDLGMQTVYTDLS